MSYPHIARSRTLLFALCMLIACLLAACSDSATATSANTVAAPTAPTPTTAAIPPTATPDANAAFSSLFVGSFTPDKTGTRGGTYTIGFAGYPEGKLNLNPYFGNYGNGLLYAPLLRINDKNQYIPYLAADVPTPANGGVKISADGKTMDVIVHLKPGLLWSDGVALTAQDFAFTYKWLNDPNQKYIYNDNPGVHNLRAVDAPDPTTIVYHYTGIYPAYLQFFFIPLPEHIWAKIPINDDMLNNPEALHPTATSGPFLFKTVNGEKEPPVLEYIRNDKFAPVFGMSPYLDKVFVIAWRDPKDVVAALRAGTIDSYMQNDYLDPLDIPGLTLTTFLNGWGLEHVSFNMNDPILKDINVRTALELAIDKVALRDMIFPSKENDVMTSPIAPQVWAYAADVQPTAYDPAKAAKLLDEAGWKVSTDGVRAKDGVGLRFTFSTTAGNPQRTRVQEFVIAAWQKIGVAVSAKNYAPSELFGTWDRNGILARGTYQIGLWANDVEFDPADWYNNYHSSGIPTETNKGIGGNFIRLNDPRIDRALETQRSTLDVSKRRAALRDFQIAYQQIKAEIPLYDRRVLAYSNPRLANYKPGVMDDQWNAVEWYVKG